MIGQPTGGITGNPMNFVFDDGSFVRICTKEDMFANGDEFVGIGIQPDIYIKPTIAALRNGLDLELKAAFELYFHKKD